MNQEEILDLVNENDEVIGQITRTETYTSGIRNFRVVDAFIRNSEGKLFVPRRHPNKRMFPRALDSSVGGHVTSGDTYYETLVREAEEELNLDITPIPHKEIGRLTPHEDGTACFVTVYEIESDVTPEYNPNDFIEHFWLRPEEIVDRLKNGDIAKGNLIKILEKFYL